LSRLTKPQQGLTTVEVAERIRQGEVNTYKSRVSRSYWDIFRDNILNLFNLIIGTLLIAVLFFRDYSTVIFAGFSVVTNSFLGMIQEALAKRQLDRLAALALSDVHIWRDNALVSLSAREIVKDDVMPITPGDRLPVDAVMLSSDALEMDESQLTGESDAVLKNEGDPVYSGSFCVAGSGVMRVTQVGKASTINQLSDVAKEYKKVLTPTQVRISLLVQITVIVMLVCTPMIFIAGYRLNGTAFTLGTFRNAVVFVSSLVPQGLVLTAALALSIGAIKISRRQTLVQRVNAVESMANVTTLCFDKTGTLTQNKLTVAQIIPLSTTITAPQIEERIGIYLANLSNLNRTAAAVAQHLETATSDNNPPALPAVTKTREVAFTSQRKWGAIVVNGETLIFGAPERVLPESATQALAQASSLAAQGMRVLAFAYTTEGMTGDELDSRRQALALIVLNDEVRPDINATLQEFRDQQVALKVITGDNLETAQQIATQAGMVITTAYTGDDLNAMQPAEFDHAVQAGNLFARIEPNTKRQIIASLKRQGEYVAMVGDGVNDVPALKEAHLAIAMNDGAQITKDVSDLVLLNNAMTTLPLAFHEGRAVRESVFGTSKIFLVKNVYSILFFIYSGFMLMPFPTNPIQISWVTLGVINIPATLIAFRWITPARMTRFRTDVLDYAITSGFIGAATLAFVYAVSFLSDTENVNLARSTVMQSMTLFGVLAFWNIHGIELFEFETIRQNRRTFWLGVGLGLFTLLIPYLLPAFLEYTVIPPPYAVLVAVVFAITIVLVYVTMKIRFVNRLWRLLTPP